MVCLQYTGHKVTLPRKSRAKNHPRKYSVNSTHGTMLFSQEREKTENHTVKIGVNSTRVDC